MRDLNRVVRASLAQRLSATLACAMMASCTTYSELEDHRTALPDFESFRVVSPVLEMHCGSMDCHGGERRNYRLYGWSGTRFTPAPEASEEPLEPVPPVTIDQPELAPGFSETTEEELWLNYSATVLLEPEATSLVMRDGESRAEELLLISKGRGREHHKGDVAMEPNGPIDRCIISWLSGGVDQTLCAASLEIGKLPPDFAQ